jgi:hypothetical protein
MQDCARFRRAGSTCLDVDARFHPIALLALHVTTAEAAGFASENMILAIYRPGYSDACPAVTQAADGDRHAIRAFDKLAASGWRQYLPLWVFGTVRTSLE